MRRALVSAVSLFLFPLAAQAGLVEPGQTIDLSSGDYTLPSGSLLAEKSVSFTIDYGADDLVGFDGMLHGTVRSAVYDNGGTLSFLYDVDFTPSRFISGAEEESDLWASSFGTFKTSVVGMFDHEDAFQALRSKDGGSVVMYSDSPGRGGAPAILITTNATAYDADGLVQYFTADEVETADGTRRVSGVARFGDMFQPAIGGSGGLIDPSPARPPTAIPLPPAAFSALGVMMAMGLIAAVRRVWDPRVSA